MLDKKRIIVVGLIILVIIIIIFFVYYFVNNKREIPFFEYIPQEEISEEQIRQTNVTLYFVNGNSLIPEIKMIDAKKLLLNPYLEILNMLLEGPKNDNLIKIIPEETKINKVERQGDILIIDFSKEFISNFKGDENNEKLLVKSIVNTITELTEINGIKILIDGEENKGFNDGKVNFEKVFIREE